MRNQITKLLSLAGLLLLPVLPLSGCLNDGGTEIPNEVKGTIYTAAGAPAANAQVRLRPVNFIPDSSNAGIGGHLVLTNASGKYALKDIPPGEYNLLATGANASAFQDSIAVTGGRQTLASDTLRSPGSVTATVQLQPQHSPQTVIVQVLGTEYYINVPASGRFTLALPQGTHRLRVAVSLPEYTTLFKVVTVTSGANDTLAEPLVPYYSGIPAVTGLVATADSAGKIRLKWNKSGYFLLQRYLVYRTVPGSLSQGSVVGSTTDTTFTDTIFAQAFGQAPGTGASPYSDTAAKPYEYRVRIENPTGEIGVSFSSASATARSAAYYRGIPGVVNLTAAADSTGRVSLRWGRSLAGYSGAFRIYRRTAGSLATGSILGVVADTAFIDTVFVQAYGQAPRTTQFAFTDTVPRAFEYSVQAYGTATTEAGPFANANATALPTALKAARSGRWHLATSAAGFGTTNFAPTALVFQNALWVFARNSSSQTGVWRSTDGIAWQSMLASLPFQPGGPASVTVLRDTLWATTNPNNSSTGIWKSHNGVSWTQVSSQASFPNQSLAVYFPGLFGFKDTLRVIGGFYSGALVYPQNKAFHSTNGIAWTATVYPQAYGLGFRTGLARGANQAAFDGALWLVGGAALGSYTDSDTLNTGVWRSTDAATWTRTATAPFLPRGGQAVTAHAGKLWVIGGYGYTGATSTGSNFGDLTREAWSSPDGVTWELVDLSAPFSARKGAAAVSFNGRLWVIGGGNATTSSGELNTQATYNDVWYYE
jgi:hypothetical protein